MPVPVSLTARSTYAPGWASTCSCAYPPSMSASGVSIVSVPAGDPAGQRAKGVHLLRLPQLLLELFALGDVHQGALDDLFAGFTRDQGHVREHPYLAAVLTPQAVFEAHQPSRLTQSG